MKRYPMTKEQRENLDQDLRMVTKSLGDVAILLDSCYGDRDPRVVRAQEAQASLQRLLWALERNDAARIGEIAEVDVKGKRPIEIRVR